MNIETAVTMDSSIESRSLAAIAGDASSHGDSPPTLVETAMVAVPGPGDDDDDDEDKSDDGGGGGNIDPDDDEGYDDEDEDDDEEPLQVRRLA